MRAMTLAYWANIVILIPIALPTVFRLFPTDQERFAESAGWRILVGALWCGILVLSILGLFQPLRYSPVLLLQAIYKVIWLIVYVGPRALQGRWDAVPWGITTSFAVIVVVWPFLIPWSYLLGADQ